MISDFHCTVLVAQRMHDIDVITISIENQTVQKNRLTVNHKARTETDGND